MTELNISHTYRLYTLLLLKTEPRTGYDIIKRIGEMADEEPSTSHIYPFLQKMEGQDYLSSEEGSRGKKVYSLTEEGDEFVDKQISSFGEMLYSAVEGKVKECAHCNCRIYDNGYEENGKVYCCRHCAEAVD